MHSKPLRAARQEGTVTTATDVHTGPDSGQRAGAAPSHCVARACFPSSAQGHSRPCLPPGE